jgi:hypothetical protein
MNSGKDFMVMIGEGRKTKLNSKSAPRIFTAVKVRRIVPQRREFLVERDVCGCQHFLSSNPPSHPLHSQKQNTYLHLSIFPFKIFFLGLKNGPKIRHHTLLPASLAQYPHRLAPRRMRARIQKRLLPSKEQQSACRF